MSEPYLEITFRHGRALAAYLYLPRPTGQKSCKTVQDPRRIRPAYAHAGGHRAALQTKILALRHQLIVYERTAPRPRLHPTDRLFWSILSRWFVDWREALVIVKPETVLRRRRFREHWARLSRSGRRPGRPRVPQSAAGTTTGLSYLEGVSRGPHQGLGGG